MFVLLGGLNTDLGGGLFSRNQQLTNTAGTSLFKQLGGKTQFFMSLLSHMVLI